MALSLKQKSKQYKLLERILTNMDSGAILVETEDEDSAQKAIENIVKSVQEDTPEPLYVLESEEGKVSIDVVRKMIAHVRRKAYGKRIVSIPFAEQMTLEADNALLKILEDTPAQTLFILVARPYSLLPTIRSRCIRLRYYEKRKTSQRKEKHHSMAEIVRSAESWTNQEIRVQLKSFIMAMHHNFHDQPSLSSVAVLEKSLDVYKRPNISKIEIENILLQSNDTQK